ncbi:MAG: Isoleucine--tRNA ligase [Methanonatronarchaeales archaeon]|nr:Isoleucine--tRNA ligase [Methanonatronarchaeales archaeon]
MEVPREYDAHRVEAKWRREWEGSDVYAYSGREPGYAIDTPPPYPTGNFHIGNALGWCYMDFTARYRRMRGFDVLFPQGWDCHGLPTEVKVEERHGITKNDVPKAEFREMCEDLTWENIEAMRATMRRLGFSQDWGHEYVTMRPEYFAKTQRSFVEMVRSGDAYRGKYPVNWCPRCQTAIADAEVEHEHRDTKLNYFYFDTGDGGKLRIASTRPELLPACVGVVVNPEDERYAEFVGETAKVPIFGQEVEVFADEDVDPGFGTGAVMVCTFGDKQDVEWWAEHDLELREAITERGYMNTLAGEFEGTTIPRAKEAVIERLDELGYLEDEEELEQHVGLCWRCETPIEILSTEQWFVEVDSEAVKERAAEVDWVPSHMRKKLDAWADEVEWDWCISRQRVFATPIPVWYCRDCGEALIPEIEDLPLNPLRDDPPRPCDGCGSTDVEAEDDVFDTWMDSSLSALHVGGWPDGFRETQLREQGHEIIRTWAFYTLLRTDALEDTVPWDTALINGMVLGGDGHKMSKSRGNYVQPEEVVEEYSADAFRLWAASGGAPGSDTPYSEREVKAGSRFMRKLWNLFRFSAPHFPDGEGGSAPHFQKGKGGSSPHLQGGDSETAGGDTSSQHELADMDLWVLSHLNRTLRDVERDMEGFQFQDAAKRLRDFAWDVLADDYVELVKGRLYSGQDPAAGATLRRCVDGLVRAMAPFTPHLCEELYSHYGDGSVHAAEFPSADEDLIDGEVEAGYGEVVDVVRRVRRWKSEEGVPLNAEVVSLEVYGAGGVVERNLDDVEATLKVREAAYRKGRPELEERPVDVDVDFSVLGPALKGEAQRAAEALKADPDAVAEMLEGGEVTVELDGESVDVPRDAVSVVEKPVSGGREVEVLEAGDATLLVSR